SRRSGDGLALIFPLPAYRERERACARLQNSRRPPKSADPDTGAFCASTPAKGGSRVMQQQQHQVVIIGAGGHGKVVLDILRSAGEYEPVGFIDADTRLAGTTVGGLRVLGPTNVLPKLRQQRNLTHAIVAIGDN